MKTSSAKAKGRRAAARVRELMLEGTSLGLDDIAVTPSGVNGDDLYLSPRAQQTYPLAIEVKNQESLNIWKALRQAEAHAESTDKLPVLFFTRNRTKLYAAIDAETLIRVLRAVSGESGDTES